MRQISPATRVQDARHVIVLALAAVTAGGALSAVLASRSAPALASLPRIPWAPPLVMSPNAAAPASQSPLAAAPFVLKTTGAERERAVRCLTEAVYYEAALEPEDGQRAVAQVVLNRVRDPNFPKSICGVVFQGWNQPPGCQFSFTCDGSLSRPPLPDLWRKAQEIAEQALNGYVMAEVGAATHYHTTYVNPWWRSTVVRIAQVGAHIFYRWPGAAGLPSALTGRYAGGEFRISDAVLSGRALPPKPAPGVTAVTAASTDPLTAALPKEPDGRVHAVIMLPGGRPSPTPAQVAEINAVLERKFPTAAPGPVAKPAPAASSPATKPAPPPRIEHVQLEPAAAKAPVASPPENVSTQGHTASGS